LLGANADAVICVIIPDDKKEGDVSIKPEEIGIRKYKEMLMATVKDILEILGYGRAEEIESEIFGIVQKPKKRKNKHKIESEAAKISSVCAGDNSTLSDDISIKRPQIHTRIDRSGLSSIEGGKN
jgi:hypothetical protein